MVAERKRTMRSRSMLRVCDKLMSRLKEHAKLSARELEEFQHLLVGCDYFSLPDHCGGVLSATRRYYRRDGTEHTLADVPLERIVEEVVSRIERGVPAERKTEVYHKVLDGVPGHKEMPEWDKAVYNPNEKPFTPFSKPSHVESNQDLLDSFSSAAGLDPDRATFIGVQITWWDASGDGSQSGMMGRTNGVWRISGGPLGRDHKLEDVPLHYFRDQLMDYIAVHFDEDKRQVVRKAICPDLTDSQIEEYASLIAEDRYERAKPDRLAAQRHEKAQRLLSGDKSVRNMREAGNLVLQEEALELVDANVDLRRYPTGVRNGDRPTWTPQSVVQPDSMQMPEEAGIAIQWLVDRDCDQVRAMIKRFVTEGAWTLEQFRHALGTVTRKKMTAFLRMRGNDGQLRLSAYILSWEFFNWRDQLGLPLSGVKVADDIIAVRKWHHERVERLKKRLREETHAKADAPKAKRQKTAERRPLQERVNGAD